MSRSEDIRNEVYRFLRQQKEFRYPDPILPGFKGIGKGSAIAAASTAAGATRKTAAGTIATTAPASAPAAARTDLAGARAELGECTRCGLHGQRTNLVFGVGNPNAKLMFIGEAPGADEDRKGEPFVGRAGQLLDKIFAAAEIRREDVYITNIVKCRPPGNRDPHPDEVTTCNPFLLQQIDAIQPQLICALGRFAAQTLLDKTEGIGRLRGRWFDWHGKRLICTYHPSACLRNESYKRPVWNDFQMLRDAYKELVEN
ncbi:MAG: uracil-DNA glycosylase [Gemmatimonadetes bacterium]|nr:uracil-DNA glycosylase [Gemmatimonadota bacterium]